MSMDAIGLYIHVPFCVSKCPYCDFYSMPAGEATMDAYTAAVCACLEQMAARYPRIANTLYFGGGTPVLLGADRIAHIIDCAQSLFGLSGAEITVEANPSGLSVPKTLKGLFAAGANRISMGLQSAVPEELQFLGRGHTPDDARRAVEAARAAGFANISLDLMLGIPQQTVDSVENSVDFCAQLGAEHISSYLLKVEEGTPFHRQNVLQICPDNDQQADIYLAAVELLAARGYSQYEISNFCKNSKVSRHNLKYWDCGEYIGVGPSAHSYMEHTRFYYPRNLQAFLADPTAVCLEEDDTPATLATLPAAAQCDVQEYMMLRLRLTQGLNLRTAASRCEQVPADAVLQAAKPMQRAGLLTVNGDTIALTPQGFLISNAVIAALIL